MIHWLNEVDWIELNRHPADDSFKGTRECLLSKETFEKIGDYTRSQPTGPSAGRIYRKNFKGDGFEDRWYVFLVIDEPGCTTVSQLHVPYKAIIV